MFDSGITAKDMIEDLKSEVDVALEIPNKSYITWLNTLEHLIYGEIVCEQGTVYATGNNGVIILSDIEISPNESPIRFEDVCAIHSNTTQLIKTNHLSGFVFPNCYYKDRNNIGYNVENEPLSFRITYYIRPALKTVNLSDEVQYGNVLIPIEYIDMVKAKLRGEAYKIANEDVISAKWINDYNILVENFKQWVKSKKPIFGM